MMADDRVPGLGLEMLIELWKVVTEDTNGKIKEQPLAECGPVPQVIDWMSQRQWEFIHKYAATFPEFKGFTQDLVDNHPRWKLLYEAKEPDNLPLHEPWYSRLSRFHKVSFLKIFNCLM